MPYLLLILTTLFWSGNFVLSRGMHAVIPPMALSFWRWSLALALLCLIAGHQLWRQRRLLARHGGFILLQGLLGVTGFNTLLYLAVQHTTAINAVLVNSCMPVLIVAFSWVLHRETMRPRQYGGVLLSLLGVLAILARGDVTVLWQVSFNRGDLLVLAAAIDWALYSVNLRRYPKDLHPLAYLTAISLVGLVGIAPLYVWELGTGRTMAVDARTVVTIGYVAMFASVLAFIFWNRAVRTIGANRAGPFVHLMPIFSTILAVLFLGEHLAWYHGLGILLIFCGILMTTWHPGGSAR